MENTEPKICAWHLCNNPITSTQGHAKFCCRACRSKASHEKKMVAEGKPRGQRFCLICGADITHTHRSRIWCDTCRPKNKNDQVNREVEAEDIAVAREGLPPLKPARIKCACGSKFDSWDTTKNRMCPNCTEKAEILNTGAVPEMHWGRP